MASPNFHLLTNGIAEWLVHALAHQLVRAVRVCPALVRSARDQSAGAYRSAPIPDGDGEDMAKAEADERGTTIAAFALGLGVLVARGTQLYRATEELQGVRVVARYAHAAVGGLSADEAGFLVAVQVVVRRADAAERSELLDVFDPTRAEAIERLVDELDEIRDAIKARLGLPPEQEWPARRALVVVPLADPADHGSVADERFNRGAIVHRVPYATTRDLARRGLRIGAGAGVLAGVAAFQAHVWAFAAAGVALAAIGPLVSVALGRLAGVDTCSDPRCESAIPPGSKVCPRCGGQIRSRPQT